MSDHSKTVILTGASRGIGHATVQRFSDEGWCIITCSREDVPAECKRDPNWTHHVVADLADSASLDRFVAARRRSDIAHAAKLKLVLRHFIHSHPQGGAGSKIETAQPVS